MATKTKATAAPKKPKRGKLFMALVRKSLITKLVREHGYNREDAVELVDGVTDLQIDEAADSRKVGAIGDGGFIAWLVAHADEIRALVEFLVGLFALVAVQAPQGEPAAAQDEGAATPVPQDEPAVA